VLRQSWKDYQTEYDRLLQHNQTLRTNHKEALAHIEELHERARLAGKTAVALTEVTGWGEDFETHTRTRQDTRLSKPIPLGTLDESEGKFAFAKVFIHRFYTTEETIVKGFFGRPKKHLAQVPSDLPEQVGVRYYTGSQEGRDLMRLTEVSWRNRLTDGIHTLDPVEHELAELSEILTPQTPID
jgi:hypothetical protein